MKNPFKKKMTVKLTEVEIDVLVCAIYTHQEALKNCGHDNVETRYDRQLLKKILKKLGRK